MVRGLSLFGKWFEPYSEQYLLIGGTAASLAMDEAGLSFRATKDLDVVLHVEALTSEFGEAFWRFVEAGGYQIRQSVVTGRPNFYRFQHPISSEFPAMVELFSRSVDGLLLKEGSRCTPIPFGEVVSSLSAILLDDVYYEFMIRGRKVVGGVPLIGADRLIPLKAVVWLDLSRRQSEGEAVDSRNIRKHMRDVVQLAQLLAPQFRCEVEPSIQADLARFLRGLMEDASRVDGATGSRHVVKRLADAYGIRLPERA